MSGCLLPPRGEHQVIFTSEVKLTSKLVPDFLQMRPCSTSFTSALCSPLISTLTISPPSLSRKIQLDSSEALLPCQIPFIQPFAELKVSGGGAQRKQPERTPHFRPTKHFGSTA